MPPVTPTQEESRKFASVMNDVNSKYQEVLTKVITGEEPLDSLTGLPAQLKQIGIDNAIKIQQSALDRYNKRTWAFAPPPTLRHGPAQRRASGCGGGSRPTCATTGTST
jgi:hypothetical protein